MRTMTMKAPYPSSPGKVIRIVRSAYGLTGTEFARQIGVSRVWLSQVENGRKSPGIKLIRKAALELKMPMPLLFIYECSDEDLRSVLEMQLMQLLR